ECAALPPAGPPSPCLLSARSWLASHCLGREPEPRLRRDEEHDAGERRHDHGDGARQRRLVYPLLRPLRRREEGARADGQEVPEAEKRTQHQRGKEDEITAREG